MIAEQVSIVSVGGFVVVLVEVNFGDGGCQVIRITCILIRSSDAVTARFICQIVNLYVPADPAQATAGATSGDSTAR